MSTSTSSNDSADEKSPAAKPKSTLVRAIIGILLVLMAVELVAYGRLLMVHRKFMAEIQMSEDKDHRFTKESVTKILGGREPNESKEIKAPVGMERYDVYYFWGLLKSRPLVVHYGVAGKNSEPEVLEVATQLPDAYLAAK